MEAKPYLKPSDWVDPTPEEQQKIIELLGKTPKSEWMIVARDASNNPLVIENAPFFLDGTPMPTRYWLVDPELVAEVSRLESIGGVKQVQNEIDEEVIELIHKSHEEQRNHLIDKNYEGPKPTGGVGGTRKGVKCLHTHLANFLATGEDEVGKWTYLKISEDE